MRNFKRLGFYCLFWFFSLFFIYFILFFSIKNQTNNLKKSSYISLAGFSFPNDAQSIRLSPYEDTYSSFNETMGGIYLFPTSIAYQRFKYEH